jgi:hypothetical protein
VLAVTSRRRAADGIKIAGLSRTNVQHASIFATSSSSSEAVYQAPDAVEGLDEKSKPRQQRIMLYFGIYTPDWLRP